MKKLFYSSNQSVSITNFLKKQHRYLLTCLTLLVSSVFLLNLAFGKFTPNTTENNLQPMPSVSVDINGKSNISYQLEVPEGTKGMDPSLSIHYNSAGGFGNMGVGWNLSGIEWITRDATYGIDYSTKDQFTSTLAGALVKGGDGNFYSRKETFMKFVPSGSSGSGGYSAPSSWTAYDKLGTAYTFTANKSQSVPNGNTTAVWALTEVKDIYGNGYIVSYSGSAITIKYADREVVLNFTSRNNTVSSYTVNTPYPSNSIISSIQIYVNSGSTLFRTYTFNYGQDFFANERLDSVGRKDNQADVTYTSISYAYSTTTQPSYTSSGEFSNSSTYPIMSIPLEDKTSCIQGAIKCFEAGAVCADPASCAIKAQKITECYAYTLTWFIPCTGGIKIPMAMTSVGDIQGDGKSEIIEMNGSESTGDLHLEATSYNGSSFVKTRVSPNLTGIQYKTFSSMGFGDVNGDGKIDFAYSDGAVLKVAFSNGSSFNAPVAYANVTAGVYGSTNWLMDKPDFKWKGSLVDMNGDGRADYVVKKNDSQLAIYLWNGSNFDNERLVDVGRIFRDQGDGSESGQFMDIDGDGKPEYVFVRPLEFPGEPAVPASLGSPGSPAAPAKDAVTEERDGDGNITRQAQPAEFARPAIPAVPPTLGVPAVPASPGASGDNSILVYYFPPGFNGTATSKSFNVQNVKTPRNRWFNDINADGKIDFVIQNDDNTIDVSFFDGVKFSNPPQRSSITLDFGLKSTTENPIKKFFTDVNGDSYPDFVRYVGDSIRVSYGNGKDFKNGSDSGPDGFSIPSKGFWNMVDLNGDGKPDIVSIKETDTSNPLTKAILSEPFSQFKDVVSNNIQHNIDVHMNRVNNATMAATAVGGPILGGIVRNIGMRSTPSISPITLLSVLQILASNPQPVISQESKVEVYFHNPRAKENQVTQVDGGFDRKISLTYDDARNFPNAILTNGAYPSLPNSSAGQVVKSVTTNMGGLIVNTDTYSYSDNRIWMGTPDKASGLGFRTRTITSSLSGDTQLERTIHSSNTLAGRSDYSETKNAIGQYEQVTNTSYTTSYPLGQEWTTVSSSSQTSYRDGVALLTTTQSLGYDSYGNVASQVTSGAGSTVTESNTYEYDTANWILARPTQVTKDIDGVVVDKTQYSYTGNTEISVTSMAGTVAAATSTIALDSYGNQRSVTDALSRTTTYEYDTVVHNYVTKVKNPKGFELIKTYDTSLGLELTALDANDGLMTRHYDKKGRLTDIVPPGSESYVERYSYTDYEDSPYFTSVSKSVVNADGTEATAKEYFDLLGRTVRKESPGIQGKFIVETTEYDAKGQVTKKSNPYLDTLETPVYTTYEYHPYDGSVTKVTSPDGNYSVPTYTGFNETMQSYASDGTLLSTVDLIKNAKGQVLTRTIDGKSLTYEYDTAGRLTKILDPENGATTTAYDNAGRKTSVTDLNSGTTAYTYDAVGNIKTQKDAKNITTTFTYDQLNRPTGVTYSSGEGNTVLTYDEGGKDKLANGRLTKVTDAAGVLELGYDIRGNRTYQKRTIDDLKVIFTRTYDIQNRLASTTYPDGTKVYQKYASTGHFSGITMDTADGRSRGYTVGSYRGPVIEDGKFKIIRETGNGVQMHIEYDPIKRRPVGLVTKLASGHTENAVAYTYDKKNNITKIEDMLVSGRTQDFVYDAQNRLSQATGKYGTETYTYSDNGNLTKRGNFTLVYGDNNHKHAVTAVTSPNTGTFNYAYDEAGNMTSRNGDTMSYNSQGKLKQIDTAGGDKLEYLYDSTGNRIKRKMKASGVVVYNFDGLYEIARTPGEAEKHTLYFKGLYGDVFSQMTRNDASLVVDGISHRGTEAQRAESEFSKEFLSGFNFCSDVSGSCSSYYINTIKYYWITSVVKGYTVLSSIEYRIAAWGMIIVILYLLSQILSKLSLSRSIITNEDSHQNPLCLRASVAKTITPLLTVAVLFTFTNCGMFGGGDKKGDAPWLMLAGGINSNSPSVDATTGASSAGGGSAGSSLVPVTGMYFLHPDHLGSITMITDGYGNPIAGGNNGGKSHISYKPYGEIHRTDSSGPDITRFKFTGQEEDKESGLMYYKARYYDPMVGRFLQSDSVGMPESTFGMNRYMYVEGNPVRFGDTSGHSKNNPLLGAIIGYAVAEQFGLSKEQGALLGAYAGSGKTNIAKDMTGGVKWASKGLENAGKTFSNAIYGTHHNEKALSHGSAFANSTVRGLKIGFALCFPVLSFVFDPAFTLGVWFTAANLIVGNVLGYGTSVHYAHGGYVIKNAPFVVPGLGITLGPFASTGVGASKMTEEHEKGHIDQYHAWGGHGYMGRFGGSLWGQGSPWGENNADSRANAWAYKRNDVYYLLAVDAALKGDKGPLLALLYWDN